MGAVGYYALTGRPPFVGDNIWDIIVAHSRDRVKPPSEVNPAVPKDLEQVIIRCLEKRPEDRYQYVESLEQASANCQCAGKWTEEDARAWWQNIEKRRSDTRRLRTGSGLATT